MDHKPPVGAPNGAPPELTEEQRQRFEALRARMEEEHRVRAALLPLFQAHEYRDGDFTMPYRFFAPENLERGKQYPIVIPARPRRERHRQRRSGRQQRGRGHLGG